MKTSHSTSISALSNEIVQTIENKEGNENLIPTGFKYLDHTYGSLSLGELVVIGVILYT